MRSIQLIGIILSATLISFDAYAYELFKNEDTRFQLIGWLRGRYVFNDPVDDELSHGTRIRMARLLAIFDHERWGSGVVHVEGNSGDVLLLDGFGRLTPTERLEVRVGLFPTRLAQDTQLPLPTLPFGERPQSVRSGLIPFRRLGIELAHRTELDDMSVLFNVGLYDPNEDLPERNGKQVSAFARARLTSGFAAHASFVALVGSDNPGNAARPLPY
ncbi:MAG: hypothetical protein AAFV29_14220, partial [Myxococcota bacterium]